MAIEILRKLIRECPDIKRKVLVVDLVDYHELYNEMIKEAGEEFPTGKNFAGGHLGLELDKVLVIQLDICPRGERYLLDSRFVEAILETNQRIGELHRELLKIQERLNQVIRQ